MKITVNALAAIVSAAVVLIFAVTKFTEGAWLVVVVFPLGVWVLIRINREYRREAAALERLPAGADRPRTRRHRVFVLVETLDLAALKALRYAHELRPDNVSAVHFAIDEAHARRCPPSGRRRPRPPSNWNWWRAPTADSGTRCGNWPSAPHRTGTPP